ncbi:RNA polymerase-binding protein RbpA [Paenarthrobacter nitroguajacolicus]
MVHGTSGYRGTRVGVTQGSAPRHQSDHGAGEQLPRIRVPYWCAKGHETRLVFLKLPDEQIPRMWDCPKCGSPATRDPGHAAPTRPEDEIFKSHLDYVRKTLQPRRRSSLGRSVGAPTRPRGPSGPAAGGLVTLRSHR